MKWEPPDPAKPQVRMSTSPSGREVWVPITERDRLDVINSFPDRWPEAIKRRETGESATEIYRHMRVHLSFEAFVEELGVCYSIIETVLHDVAKNRARLMV